MGSIFSREQIIDLKQKLDFEKFYKSMLPNLTQRGRLFWTNCCFHNDNSPSMSIDIDTGIYKCWSCGQSGDCISFYQKLTGKSFNDTIVDIAKSQDIKLEISEELKKELNFKKSLYAVNNGIANFYQKALSKDKSGQEYVLKRGFTLDSIKKFRIGYIPKVKLAQVGDNNFNLLKEAGLINVSEEYGAYNYFSTNRISIPFCDEYGHIVGFSSRAINNDIQPKYLHSRTNKIFKKDELLFGFHLAKQTIKETKSVIMVEGQIDCIKAHQFGITNTIATCGLALSEKQLKLLKSDVKNYYIVIEDKAGEKALDKFYDTIISENFFANVKIIRLYEQVREKCDLDEFLTKFGKGAFLEKIKKAPNYNEYKLIDSLKNINYRTIEEKKFHIYNVRKYIAKIQNPIDKKQYIELLATKLELPENDIRKVIARAEQTDSQIQVGKYDDRRTVAQKYIIASFFSHFGVQTAYETLKELKVQNKLDKQFRKIYDKIIDTILLNGAKSDIINIIHSSDVMTEEELNILRDSYFKRDEFDYLSNEEENELELFIKDQLLNLR